MDGLSPDPAQVRDCWRCVFCGHRAHSVHHRNHDHNDNRLSNKLSSCGDGTRGDHGWTEGHPEAAFILGWSVTRFGPGGLVKVSRVDTSACKCWLPFGLLGEGWYLLDDDGGLGLMWPQPDPPEVPVTWPGTK